MIIKTTPRNRVTRLLTETVIASLAAGTPLNSTSAAHTPATKGPAGVEIRIHRDGLLVAKGHAIGIAPSRLFVAVDPLHYPVNTRLEIEFINGTGRTAESARLYATVASRSIDGIELKLDPAPLA